MAGADFCEGPLKGVVDVGGGALFSEGKIDPDREGAVGSLKGF